MILNQKKIDNPRKNREKIGRGRREDKKKKFFLPAGQLFRAKNRGGKIKSFSTWGQPLTTNHPKAQKPKDGNCHKSPKKVEYLQFVGVFGHHVKRQEKLTPTHDGPKPEGIRNCLGGKKREGGLERGGENLKKSNPRNLRRCMLWFSGG